MKFFLRWLSYNLSYLISAALFWNKNFVTSGLKRIHGNYLICQEKRHFSVVRWLTSEFRDTLWVEAWVSVFVWVCFLRLYMLKLVCACMRIFVCFLRVVSVCASWACLVSCVCICKNKKQTNTVNKQQQQTVRITIPAKKQNTKEYQEN